MKIERYAGIDIGSNGVRLLIMNEYKYQGVQYINKTSLVRSPIRLGEDSFMKKEISQESIDKLSSAMVCYRELMKLYRVTHYRACATSAIRESKNKEEIVEEVYRRSGIRIEVIDGLEEAEILYSTQIKHLINDNNPYLFIDVGGGSTEITYYNDNKKHYSQSYKIGTVRLLQNQVNPEEWTKLKTFLTQIDLPKDINAMGSGGNINTLFKYSQKTLGKALSRKYIQNFYDDIKSQSIDERIVKYQFNPDRADVIQPALEIYLFILNTTGIKKLYVPKIGLADGLIRNLIKEKSN